MRAIITVVGKDKKGIIAGVSTELCANEINILDINQTIMSEFFTMVMLVDLTGMPVSIDVLKTRLDSLGERLGVSIRGQRVDIFNSMHRI